MSRTYYVIKINYRVSGRFPGKHSYWTEYARKADYNNSWYSTDVLHDGFRFVSLKKAAAAARRLNICKLATSKGGNWEIVEVCEKIVADSSTHGRPT